MANKQKNNNKRTIHTHKGKKQAETLRTTAGTEDLCIHLQNHLVTYKFQHSLTLRADNCILGYLPDRNDNIYQHKGPPSIIPAALFTMEGLFNSIYTVHWIVCFSTVLQCSAEDGAGPRSCGANVPHQASLWAPGELILCTVCLNKPKLKPNTSEVIPPWLWGWLNTSSTCFLTLFKIK